MHASSSEPVTRWGWNILITYWITATITIMLHNLLAPPANNTSQFSNWLLNTSVLVVLSQQQPIIVNYFSNFPQEAARSLVPENFIIYLKLRMKSFKFESDPFTLHGAVGRWEPAFLISTDFSNILTGNHPGQVHLSEYVGSLSWAELKCKTSRIYS